MGQSTFSSLDQKRGHLSTQQPDLDPVRVKHESYDFTDSGNNYQTAYEIADTLDDCFGLARVDKLKESQVEDFIRFVDEDRVFRVAVIMVPEVARLIGEDYWVEDEDDGKRSAQIAHILHAIAHREPRSRRLSRPAEDIETNEQRDALQRQAQEIANNTNADIEAAENGTPSTRIEVGQVTTVGDLIRSRQDAGRISWRERHSGT